MGLIGLAGRFLPAGQGRVELDTELEQGCIRMRCARGSGSEVATMPTASGVTRGATVGSLRRESSAIGAALRRFGRGASLADHQRKHADDTTNKLLREILGRQRPL